MKNLVNTIAFVLIAMMTFAQSNIDVTIKKSTSNETCMSIYLTPQSGDVLLRGQNYRLFYNDAKATFLNVNLTSELEKNNFEAEVAMHRQGLSKAVNGSIQFENNMAYISLNVMPDDIASDYVYMTDGKMQKVSEVCFSNALALEDLVLAERNITQEYSNSFTVIFADNVEKSTSTSIITASLDENTININPVKGLK